MGSLDISGVAARLNAEIQGIAKRTAAGVLKGAEIILEKSIENTPLDQGPLSESARAELIEAGEHPLAVVAYKSPYAPAIHENPRAGRTGGISPSGQKYKHWATTGSWKFLERAVDEKRSEALAAIAENAAVGK